MRVFSFYTHNKKMFDMWWKAVEASNRAGCAVFTRTDASILQILPASRVFRA
jgi:hypothetical protein